MSLQSVKVSRRWNGRYGSPSAGDCQTSCSGRGEPPANGRPCGLMLVCSVAWASRASRLLPLVCARGRNTACPDRAGGTATRDAEAAPSRGHFPGSYGQMQFSPLVSPHTCTLLQPTSAGCSPCSQCGEHPSSKRRNSGPGRGHGGSAGLR